MPEQVYRKESESGVGLHRDTDKRSAVDYDECLLYGEIEEEVYVTQPKDLKDPYFPKHGDTEWLKSSVLTSTIKHLDPVDIIIGTKVYVDDIIFGSTNKAWCDEFEDMYVKDYLTKFDMESVRTATTPYEAAKTKLKDETESTVNVGLLLGVPNGSAGSYSPADNGSAGCPMVLLYIFPAGRWFLLVCTYGSAVPIGMLLVDSFNAEQGVFVPRCHMVSADWLPSYLLPIVTWFLLIVTNPEVETMYPQPARGMERGSEDFNRYPQPRGATLPLSYSSAPNALRSHDLVATIDGRRRETTPERQPETEWVVPNPVSPGTDWRPWPSVLAPRPPTPPAQTLSLEEPLVFGPVPKPAGYVDPDSIDPIIFGPPPRPYDFVDPALEESVIFGPLPRPANYIEPEDITNLNSMEDETILGGFHEETHAGPDDAPTPTADAAGRAEDPALLTSLSAKIEQCNGTDRLMELTTNPSEDIEECEEEEVSRRHRGRVIDGQDRVLYSCLCAFSSPRSTDVPSSRGYLENPGEARQRLEEEQASARIPLARELLGADVNEDNFIERMTAIKERKKRALAELRYRALKVFHPLDLLLFWILLFLNTKARCSIDTTGTASTVPTSAAMDSAASRHELGISPFVDSDNSSSPSPVSTDHIPIDVLFDSTSGGLHEFFLASDEDAPICIVSACCLTLPQRNEVTTLEILFPGLNPFLNPASLLLRSRSIHRGVRSHLHSDDVENFGEPQDDWVVSKLECFPKSSASCLAAKEFGSPLQTALVCNSNPLIALFPLMLLVAFYSFLLLHVVAPDCAGYFVYCCCLLCSCCSSILLPQEDLSRNLELTESTPIVPADSLNSIPADNVPAGRSSSIPADYDNVPADSDRIC
ncbi:hypothetical protein Tco_0449212 [Tanacetum coccineum]